jgi:hypothetical protein
LKNFFNTSSFARSAAVAAFSRLKASWGRRVRCIALVLVAALLVNSLGQDSVAEPKRHAALEGVGLGAKTTLVVAALVTTVALIGTGVYLGIQRAHTVKGCVSDNPDGLLLQTQDGKTYVLLGATTNIKADQRIKVRGTKRKKIDGVTDQPSFVVEKLDKVYGTCPVAPIAPTATVATQMPVEQP